MEQLIHDYPFNNQDTTNQKLYRKGEVIYHVQTPSFGFFYVVKGTLKIFSIDASGREIIHRLAGSGDIIGHEYLLGEKIHPESARALEDTICQFIEGAEFRILMINNPSMAMLIMHKMQKELLFIKNRCIELLKKNVRERLASYFLYMADNHSDHNERGLKIRIQLSREEIASLIGTANETAIRFISEFKELGLIEEEDRVFFIRDLENLSVIAKV